MPFVLRKHCFRKCRKMYAWNSPGHYQYTFLMCTCYYSGPIFSLIFNYVKTIIIIYSSKVIYLIHFTLYNSNPN